MRPVSDFPTVTVEIHVPEWMHRADELACIVLMNFINDCCELMEWNDHITACKLATEPTLWYTFRNQQDAYHFIEELRDIWKNGWLAAGEN